MSRVKVCDTRPKFPYKAELVGNALNIWFQDGYIMPKDTHFAIRLFGSDLGGMLLAACGSGKLEMYSFTTTAD